MTKKKVHRLDVAGWDKPAKGVLISSIVELPNAVRTVVEDSEFAAFTESIRECGLLQAVAVSKRGKNHVLIFGSNRLRAMKNIGEKRIPAVVGPDIPDEKIIQYQTVENLQRRDMSAIELGGSLWSMIQAGETMASAAAKVGLEEREAWRFVDLLKLDGVARDLVQTGRISPRHGYYLARVADIDVRHELACACVGLYQSMLCEDTNSNRVILAQALAGDYVIPLKELRERVSDVISECKMGKARWAKDVEYAGHPPCDSCPSWTRNDPTLFEGIDESSAKGNCANPACYADKAAEWETDPIKIAADVKRERIAANKSSDDSPTKPKPKAQPDPLGDLPADGNAGYAIARFDYGVALAEAVRRSARMDRNKKAAAGVCLALSGSIYCANPFTIRNAMASAGVDLDPAIQAGTGIPADQLESYVDLYLAEAFGLFLADAYRPQWAEKKKWMGGDYRRIGWEIANVPLYEKTESTIEMVEALADRFRVAKSDRPAVPMRADFEKPKNSGEEGRKSAASAAKPKKSTHGAANPRRVSHEISEAARRKWIKQITATGRGIKRDVAAAIAACPCVDTLEHCATLLNKFGWRSAAIKRALATFQKGGE